MRPTCPMLAALPTDSRCGRGPRSKPPSSSGLGLRPFKAAARVRIPLGVRYGCGTTEQQGPVAQLVSASPCHGEGRGFESRLGRFTPGAQHRSRPGSSVGTSDRLKSGRSAVRPRPWPPSSGSACSVSFAHLRQWRMVGVFWGPSPQTPRRRGFAPRTPHRWSPRILRPPVPSAACSFGRLFLRSPVPSAACSFGCPLCGQRWIFGCPSGAASDDCRVAAASSLPSHLWCTSERLSRRWL
jgi:hypothetical protein